MKALFLSRERCFFLRWIRGILAVRRRACISLRRGISGSWSCDTLALEVEGRTHGDSLHIGSPPPHRRTHPHHPTPGPKILRTFATEGTHRCAFSTRTNGRTLSIDDSHLLHRVLGAAPRAAHARRPSCRQPRPLWSADPPPRASRGRALASDSTPPLRHLTPTLYI